ncbi:MAG: hypothetical protein P1U88_20480 [Thalassobaculaceae bacterium]|nr:hypothetical protein [Thalassobaculaceae bacterium]
MALIIMLMSVTLYGLQPLVISLYSSHVGGLVYVATSLSLASFCLFLTLVVCSFFIKFPVIKAAKSIDFHNIRLFTLDAIFNGSSFFLLFIALRDHNQLIVTVGYETWPIALVLILPFFIRNKKFSSALSPFIFSSLVGIVIVGTARDESQHFELNLLADPGLLQALGAGFLMAVSSAAHIANTNHFIRNLKIRKIEDKTKGFLSVVIISMISRGFSGVLFIILSSLFETENISSDIQIDFAILCTSIALIAAFGSVFFALANQISKIIGINLMWNLVPVFAVFLLLIFGKTNAPDPIFFIGAMFIISSNLAVSLQADFSISYKAALFLLPLWALACFSVPGSAEDDYFGAVAVPASIFAILVAFLNDRLSGQRNRREEIGVALLQSIETDVHDDDKIEFRKRVLEIMSHNSDRDTEVGGIDSFHNYKDRYPSQAAQIFLLVSSKVRLNSFGEIFILWMLASVTLMVSFFARPDSVISDIICLGINTSVIFLSSTILDIDNMRRKQLFSFFFSNNSQKTIGGLVFLEGRSFLFSLIFSSAFIAILFSLYIFALLSREGLIFI